MAEWYSIIGLTTIFAGAPVPVMIFGILLGIGKIVAIVWLRKYWSVAHWLLRSYLLAAAIGLSCLTSVGIFGYLSKAHTDSALAPAEKVAQLEHIDTKIGTLTEEITGLKSELAMLDKQVNSYLDRGDAVSTVTKSVQLRRNQSVDRKRIQKEIEDAQTAINTLREQRVPVDMALKKLEAEVGPIKYVAAVIYGDNPDSNLLDRAVRWMTIMLVVVFDPLAVALVIAANHSKDLEAKLRAKLVAESTVEEELVLPQPVESPITAPVSFDPEPVAEEVPPKKKPRKPRTTKSRKKKTAPEEQPAAEDSGVSYGRLHTQHPIPVTGMTREVIRPTDDYIIYQGKKTHVRVVRETSPKLFMTPEEEKIPLLRYGVEFPKVAASGERFTRIDLFPHCLYMFVAGEWVLVSELDSDRYIDDPQYLNQVRSLIAAGYATAEFFGKDTADRLAIDE